MAKKFTVSSENLKPDPVYHSRLVSKFINCMMYDGKKSRAQAAFYDALKIIEKKNQDAKPMEVFEKAINNVKPMLRYAANVSAVPAIRFRCRSVPSVSSRWRFDGFCCRHEAKKASRWPNGSPANSWTLSRVKAEQ